MTARVADFWTAVENNTLLCGLCPHNCNIKEKHAGKCGARVNREGILFAESYGRVTSIALDPIEKKPLSMFHPGKKIVSIGSYGCNLNCGFCQNFNISMEYKNIKLEYMTPELVCDVAVMAVADENIGIAYTYNEPLIGFEFLIDCSKLIKKAGLVNVLVTNGYLNPEPLNALLPYIDALNIDIKGIQERTYNRVGGTLEPVKKTIKTANTVCHVEVTTLVVPGENENEVLDIAKWLSSVDENIPYHLSRFFPRYKFSNSEPTPPNIMYELYEDAKKYLKNVFLGNM